MMNRDSLAATVRRTYYERFSDLELEYQLHFASRLYTWGGEPEAARKLAALRPVVMPGSHAARVANLQGIAHELQQKDFARDINNYRARKPYFEKYPRLMLAHNTLFRIRHWKCLYGVDERPALYDVVPKEEMRALVHNLRQDTGALLTLSTYAINTLYLFEKIYPEDAGQLVDAAAMLRLKENYDHTDKKHLQLLMYLYTHCILGETLFYFQPVGGQQDVYQAMLQEIERIITASYDDITLDNKFEFLVCARLRGFESALPERIYDEAVRSLNHDGFLVDTHNNHVTPHKQTFVMSEHRNVLFIMSTTPPVYNRRPVLAES